MAGRQPQERPSASVGEDIFSTCLGGDFLGARGQGAGPGQHHAARWALEHMFGGERDPQEAIDEKRWFAHELRETVRWQPDLDALRTASTRIVIGIGEESGGQLAEPTSIALAAALGIEPEAFPGGHTGFAEDPDRFATRLRAVFRQS